MWKTIWTPVSDVRPDRRRAALTAEQYKPIYHWFSAHPTVKRLVVFLDRWLPLVPFVCYPVLLYLLTSGSRGCSSPRSRPRWTLWCSSPAPSLCRGWCSGAARCCAVGCPSPAPTSSPALPRWWQRRAVGTPCLPPRAERRRAGGGVAVFLPCRWLRDGGHCPAHLLPAGAHRGASCAGRGMRLCTGFALGCAGMWLL